MGKSKNSRTLEVLKNLVGDDLFQTALEVFAGQKLSFPVIRQIKRCLIRHFIFDFSLVCA